MGRSLTRNATFQTLPRSTIINMSRIYTRLALFAAVCGLGMASLQAQTPTQNQEKKQEVTRSTISTDEITLIKDSDRNALEDRSPASVLQSRVDAGHSNVQTEAPASQALDINKVRVIHPNNYNALSDEQKAKIDANPYYVVSELSRREVMAEFINGERAVSAPAAKEKPAPAKP